jgi:hypothetical protein
MNDFESWYKTFESDGQELFLYNAYDLEAAFLAGMEAQRRIDVEIAKRIETHHHNCVGHPLMTTVRTPIAAAIEKGGGK